MVVEELYRVINSQEIVKIVDNSNGRTYYVGKCKSIPQDLMNMNVSSMLSSFYFNDGVMDSIIIIEVY